MQTHTDLVSAFTAELLAKLQVGAGQGAQSPVGRKLSILAFRGGFMPSGRCGLDIAGKNFGQVVVAVELVFVLDADEGGGHVSQSYSAACVMAQMTLIHGCGSVVMVSSIHFRYSSWMTRMS